MKITFIFILTIITFNTKLVFAQTKTDSIKTKSFLGGYIYKQNDRVMSIIILNKVLKTDSEASKEWKLAMKNYYPAIVLRLIGAGLTGFALGSNKTSEKKLIITGIGLGFIGLSIPLQRKLNQHTKKAVDLYNSSLK